MSGSAVRRLGRLRESGCLEFIKASDESSIFALALVAVGFDDLENRAQAIQQFEQAGNDGQVRGELAVAQDSEEIFARVGQLFEPLEAQEPGGSLDGMH